MFIVSFVSFLGYLGHSLFGGPLDFVYPVYPIVTPLELRSHGLGTLRTSRLARRKAQLSVLCLSQDASIIALAHTTYQQRFSDEVYIILLGDGRGGGGRGAKNT